MHHLGIWGRGIAPLQHPSYQRPQQSRPLIPGISAISRERIAALPCIRLSRIPWTDVTPSSTMDPLSLHSALATCPPIPVGSACSFQRCSLSNFSVSLRCLSVFLLTCEQAREAYPVGEVVQQAPFSLRQHFGSVGQKVIDCLPSDLLPTTPFVTCSSD